MAHTRTSSTVEGPKGPHPVSLKVLRLSRPTLAQQSPSPSAPGASTARSPTTSTNEPTIPSRAGQLNPYDPPSTTVDSYALTPLLTLPASFGSAHVGSTFACTLCASFEPVEAPGSGLGSSAAPTVDRVKSVAIHAVVQTPSLPQGVPLDLLGSSDDAEAKADEAVDLTVGGRMQRIVSYDLVEEGMHVLAVTVSYTELLPALIEGAEPVERQRTFRKLYQFVAQQLLAVRTKASELAVKGTFALEAQVENLGEGTVVLEHVELVPKEPYNVQSINGVLKGRDAPILKWREVWQLAFLVTTTGDGSAGSSVATIRPAAGVTSKIEDSQTRSSGPEGRVLLGQLAVRWRRGMGETGSMKTGWLSGKRR